VAKLVTFLAGLTSPNDVESAPRLIVGLLCYWGLLERRTLWESVQLRIRTGHRQASGDAVALPKRARKAAHVPSRASIPESHLGYKTPIPTLLYRSKSLTLWYNEPKQGSRYRGERIGGRMERTQVGSGAPWEAIVGYSRAVRVGQQVFVAGTTATDATGAVVGVTAYEQARQALRNIESALERCGARMADVVRTRMYVANIDDWEEIGRAHGEVFGAIRPAATMVEVKRLIDPAMLVEIEVDAIIAEAAGDGS